MQAWKDIHFTSFDGLALYGRCYPAGGTFPLQPGQPVVLCLANLTDNSHIFDPLARFLSQHPDNPRTVYTIDYRGRGQSDDDPDWRNYTPYIEMRDVLDFITLNNMPKVTVIGTARGGMIATLIASARPNCLEAVVLNDSGPVIETHGISRMASYLQKTPRAGSWERATKIMHKIHGGFYPRLTQQGWENLAESWFCEKKGRLAPCFDQRLVRIFRKIKPNKKLPELWMHYVALRRIPLLVLRGEHSDILSAETLDRMVALHHNCLALSVPDQGHAPLLWDRPSQTAIHKFIRNAGEV